MAEDLDQEKLKAALNLAGKHGELYYHIGLFVCQYAGVERAVHTMFHFLSGLQQPVAKAMIGGMRLGDILNIIVHVIQHTGQISQEQRDIFRDCFEQLNHITTFRNTLIHRGAFANPQDIISTNAITARSPEAVEIWRFQLKDVLNAAEDSHCIAIKLLGVTFPGMIQLLPAHEQARLALPWRYKPLRPEKSPQAPRSTPE